MELNQEQLVHELERKHMATSEALLASNARSEALEAEVRTLKAEADAHVKQLQDAKSNEHQLSNELAQITQEKARLDAQLHSVLSLSDQRLEELRAERERAADQAKQLVELQTSETRALQAQAQLEAKLLPLQLEVTRLHKDREHDKVHVEELQNRLVEKSRALTEFRLQHNKKLAEVEHQNADLAEQVEELKKMLRRVTAENASLKEDVRVARENAMELHTEHSRALGHLEKELSAQHRLTDLYKDAVSDANIQVEALQAKCDTLQTALHEAEDALAEESQKVREETQAATMDVFTEQTRVFESKIDELEIELRKSVARVAELEATQSAAATQVATISEFSPTAGELHLASHGLSPTDMYNRIVELEKQVQDERTTKETLEKYLERILNEVTSKAPYLDRLKKENQRALAAHDQLSERLDVCMADLSRARETLRAAQSEKRKVEVERDTLQQSVADLSKQIQQLLFQSLQSSSPVVDASESLVVFRSVEELQTRNQQLLRIVRELSEAKGDHKSSSSAVVVTIEPDDTCTSAQWEKVQEELTTLRAEREREQEMVAAIVKQRDMYRVLLSQADTRFVDAERLQQQQPSSPRPSTSLALIATESYESRMLRELRLEFDDYKKEKQAVVTELRDTVDGLRVECSKAKMSGMEAKVHVKSLEDKIALIESRKADVDKELHHFRSKYDQSNALLIQTQKQAADLSAKLDARVAEVQSLHGELQKTKTELAFMTTQEERHRVELATMRSEQTSQLKLMEAVHRIEAHQTDRQAQEVARLTTVATALEIKLADKQRALDDAQSLASAKIAELTLETKSIRKMLDAEKVAHASVREVKAGLDEKAKALTNQIKALSEEVAVLKVQLKKGAGVAAAERVSSLETQLHDAKQELHAALTAKQTAEQHAEQYKVISEANEKSFAVLSASSEKLKAEHDAATKAIADELATAKHELAELQKKMLNNIAEENKLREEMDSWDQTKREELRKSNDRVVVAESQLASCKQELNTVKDSLAGLEADLATAQDNYSRELQAHATAEQQLNDLRKQMDAATKAIKAAEGQRDELQRVLNGIEGQHTKTTDALKDALADAQSSVESLTEQNKLLHSQLDVLTQDFNRLQEAATLKAFHDREAVPETEHDKQVRELRAIISSLRRDLEIAQSKSDVAKQEVLRHQGHIKTLEKSLDRVKAEYEVSKLEQAKMLTATEQNKRSAQLDTLSLLRESNAMLRDENDKNLKKCKDKDAIIESLEAQIQPLQTAEGVLKSQIQALKEDVESLTQANKRWKDRVNQLVEKYQQIDPAEHEQVCTERNQLKARVDELVAATQAVSTEDKKRIEELVTEKKHAEERLARMRLFVKDWQQQAKAAKERVAELEASKSESESKESSVRESEKALESKVKALDDQVKALDQKAKLGEEKRQLAEAELKAKLDSESKKNGALKDMNTKLLQRCNAFRQEIAELKASRVESSEQPTTVQPPLSTSEPAVKEEIVVEAEQPVAVTAPAATRPPVVVESAVEAIAIATPLPPLPPTDAPSSQTQPAPVVAQTVCPPLPTEEPKAPPAADDPEKIREMALRTLLLKSKKIPKDPTSAAPTGPPATVATTEASDNMSAEQTPTTVPAVPAPSSAPPTAPTVFGAVGTFGAPSTLNATAPAFTSGFGAFAASKGLSFLGMSKPKEKAEEPAAPPVSVTPKSSNPFLNLAPPSASGSAPPTLTFGKSNITLPVPTLTADASQQAPLLGVDREAEEQKRVERALRFNAAEKTNKRPAPGATDGTAPPPAKKANTDAVDDEEKTDPPASGADDPPSSSQD
ncbi:hypothetical protein H310_06763 [Aphanomyces invadans]|uniref:Uncharacterized protein n=1 Tax=Aphanomyces invadans TaxID=157072 RepID=A0A024U6B5_9STRA|nr:hypothetical protein H310_06763 [Aphanomyces invadans]ETW01163.1 hypothetical protein H310_06763 [Aphanomyces invadans]|eukprot:XP_008870161.1 hypothetical protein H310_06763 [Aphanomyces invadans]